MSLEISGNTINGNISLSKWKSYSNFVEENIPANETNGSNKLWAFSYSESWYGHGQWQNSEDAYLRAYVEGGSSSTGGSASGTIKTNVDLRKYSEFKIGGTGSMYKENWDGSDNYTRLKFGIINNGSSTTLQELNNPDYSSSMNDTVYYGWTISGKFEGDQLYLTYSGLDNRTETTTINVNGEIQIFCNAYASSEYPLRGKAYNGFNIIMVK